MGCDCAATSFAEYFTDEAERIQKQILDFPETFKDVWSDLANVQQDEVKDEVLAAVAQGALSNTSIQSLIDLVKTGIQSGLGQTQMPRFETALEELSQVKDTQEAVKVLAGLVFILWSDSIFHVMNILAKKIVRLAGLKASQVAQLEASIRVAGAAISVFEAAGVDSQEIRDRVLSAASDVALAEALTETMRKSAARNTQVRRTLIDRARAHLQDAMDKLNDSSIDGDTLQAGGLSVLLGAAEPLAVASGAMLLSSMYIKEMRRLLASLETTSRQLSSSIAAFQAGVDEYKTAPMTNYQLSILRTAKNRLTETRSGMQAAARYGTMPEIAEGMTGWVPSIGTVMEMLKNLPPEIREQEELNSDLLAAYDRACAFFASIDGTHISKGAESTTDLVRGVERMIVMMENIFSMSQTSSVADHVRYFTEASSGIPFPALDFVTARPTGGAKVVYFMDGPTMNGVPAVSALTPPPSRLDESLIHAALAAKAAGEFLAVQPPENAVITTLLELLKVLQMGRGSDLLMMGNISEFMDATPLGWSYVGNAVDCMQKAMKAALDDGQDALYDELDTHIEPMLAKVHGLKLRMQRESAYSINTILEKLEATVTELDTLKESIEGIIDKVDC